MSEVESLCAELTAIIHSDVAVLNVSSLEELQEAALASARSLAPQMNPVIELQLDPNEPNVIMLGVTWSMTVMDRSSEA